MINKISQPLVSVCIPLFNGENYLADCINSIIDQDYENFEILIIDNFSTDSSISIIESFEDSRIRLIRNDSNIGSLKNFSKCVENARGEYFVLLPHDDILLPGCLSEFAIKLDNPSIGIVFGAVQVINEHGNIVNIRENHSNSKILTNKESLINLVDNFMPIQLAMVRTSILKKFGGFSTKFSLFSDCHLWFRVALDGWYSFYCNNPLSSHRVHKNQGQNAFMVQDLKVAGEHMGKKLDRRFWKEHNYNHLFLRLSEWLIIEMQSKKYDNKTIKKVKKSLLKEVLLVHIVNVVKSILMRNAYIFWLELINIKGIVNLYGFFNVFNSYFLTLFLLLKRKIL